jgi:hypothetical protein
VDGLAIYQQLPFRGFNTGGQCALQRVVFQKMSQGFAVGQVIDCHHLKVIATQRGAQYVSANATKPINAYFDHDVLLGELSGSKIVLG